MTRHILTLSRANRPKAVKGVLNAPDGWILELREARRTDDQNSALWSLLSQIHKQRPAHNGVRMTPDLYKAVFLQALGAEMVMLPTLDGDGYFPLGHRSSQLTKSQFSNLIELILAWTAREGLEINHFDEAAKGGSGANNSRAEAAQ